MPERSRSARRYVRRRERARLEWILRQVDVRGSVVFSVEPIDDDPFTVTRVFDGSMRSPD